MGKQSKILMILSGLIVILFVGSYFLIQATDNNNNNKITVKTEKKTENKVKIKSELGKKEETVQTQVPESTTGLMIGFDQSNNLTDVLMVGYVDTEHNNVKVISIPRDFLIDFRKEPFKSIKKANPKNKIAYCRINEIYINMGASEEGLKTLKSVIEAITGLKIDHMATINVSGFKEVVDIVGGVEFDVPVRMYKMDPYQKPPLRIDLKPGLQVLNGEKAQGLVRFRGYPNGDFQRIKMQHEFMVALFKKIVSSSPEQMNSLIKQIFKIFKADFGLVEMMDYINYFLDKDIIHVLNNTNMITLEGWNERLESGAAVLEFDIDKNQELIQKLLKNNDNGDDKDEKSSEDSENKDHQKKETKSETKSMDGKSPNKEVR